MHARMPCTARRPPASSALTVHADDRVPLDDCQRGCAVIGGYVYRGQALPSLQGQYLFGDFCLGWVKSFAADAESPEAVDRPALSPGEPITSFGEDDAGELYIMTVSGSVLKIAPQQ